METLSSVFSVISDPVREESGGEAPFERRGWRRGTGLSRKDPLAMHFSAVVTVELARVEESG